MTYEQQTNNYDKAYELMEVYYKVWNRIWQLAYQRIYDEEYRELEKQEHELFLEAKKLGWVMKGGCNTGFYLARMPKKTLARI